MSQINHAKNNGAFVHNLSNEQKAKSGINYKDTKLMIDAINEQLKNDTVIVTSVIEKKQLTEFDNYLAENKTFMENTPEIISSLLADIAKEIVKKSPSIAIAV